jgi:hypothetical protein
MAFVERISDLSPARWNRLEGTGNPFLRHEFLSGLEITGCTTADTGWQPHHWVETDDSGILKAALPCYLKTHSFGEYVFDWAWAEAWAHYGLDYYPKLLSAIPFTPCEGPRLLVAPGEDPSGAGSQAAQAMLDEVQAQSASGWHLLFPDGSARHNLHREEWMTRLSCQFHWHNEGFSSFEDFLGALKSRKRKQIRKERGAVTEQGIHFQKLRGEDISEQALDAFFLFYQATYLKRGQRPYLNRAFFEHLVNAMPEQLFLVMAVHEGRYCAAALFLHDRERLYGRYWGCLEEYDQLHFEACYYQGIDFCIERGLSRFDAGAQGEHKLKRGFRPHLFESFHWIQDPRLRPAVADFCRREAQAVRAYAQEARLELPFRESNL